MKENRPSPQRVADKFSSLKRRAVSPPTSQLPGTKTYIREKSDDGLPTNSDRTPQTNLPPSAATPRVPADPNSEGEKEKAVRSLGPATFNVPDGSADEIKSRTRPAEGEEYGHPYNDQTTNFRVLRNIRTAFIPAHSIPRIASMWLEGKIKTVERRHVKPKGRHNTPYRFDKPYRRQHEQPPKKKRKDRLRYLRQRPKRRLYNRIRYKKQKRKPFWRKKKEQAKKTNVSRLAPNISAWRNNRKQHQKVYNKKQKRKAMGENMPQLTELWGEVTEFEKVASTPNEAFIKSLHQSNFDLALIGRDIGFKMSFSPNCKVQFKFVKDKATPDVVVLSTIETTADPSCLKKGYGTQVMRKIVSLADSAGVKIRLFANPQGDIPLEDLKAWYRKFDFVDQSHDNMIRQPKRNKIAEDLLKAWFGDEEDLEDDGLDNDTLEGDLKVARRSRRYKKKPMRKKKKMTQEERNKRKRQRRINKSKKNTIMTKQDRRDTNERAKDYYNKNKNKIKQRRKTTTPSKPTKRKSPSRKRKPTKRRTPSRSRSRKPSRSRSRSRSRRASIEWIADQMMTADFLYEIRPPDYDELDYPEGTPYSPSGGPSMWKRDPANRDRKPLEKNPNVTVEHGVNTTRVVPKGQFVTAKLRFLRSLEEDE